MNEARLADFEAVYRVELAEAVTNYPDEYAYGAEQVPAVVGRMMDAIRARSYNKDSRALRRTFKAFGIPHTYKGLRAWLDNEAEGGAAGIGP